MHPGSRELLTIAACAAFLASACSSSHKTDGGAVSSGTSSASVTSSSGSSTTGMATNGATDSSSTSAGTTTTGTTSTSGGTSTGDTTGSATSSGGSTGGSLIGMPCDPTVAPDSMCAPSYYFCQSFPLPDGGVAGSCQLPGEMIECSTSVGCAANDGGQELDCTPGFTEGNTTVNLCVYSCSITADCPSLWTSCVPFSSSKSVCFSNNCAGTAGPFFVACNSGGSNDGQCLPSVAYPNPPSSDPYGICVGGGTALLDGPCSPVRTDAGLSEICPIGGLCQVGADGGSACFQISDAYCGPTNTAVFPSSPPPPIFSGPPSWFLCLHDCDGGGSICPTGQACMPVDAGANSFVCFVQ
jgi:hypothetical protein